MAIVRGATASGVGSNTSTSTLVLSTTPVVGSYRIMSIAWNPDGNQTPTISSITDANGGTWAAISSIYSSPTTTSAGTGLLTQTWWRTTPETAGAYNITITLSAAVAGIAARSYAYSNVDISLTPAVVTARGATAGTMTALTLPTIDPNNDMFILTIAEENTFTFTNPTAPTATWGSATAQSSGGIGTAAIGIAQNNSNSTTLTTGISVSGQTISGAANWAEIGIVVYGIKFYSTTGSASISITGSAATIFAKGPQYLGATTGIQNTVGSTMTIASGAWLNKAIEIGDKILILLAFDPASSTTPTVTITATNFTFSALASIVNSPATPSAGVGTKIQGWIGTATAAGTTSLAITGTWSNSITHAASSVYGFRYLGTSQRNAATSGIGATTTAPPYSITTPSGNSTDLILAMQGQEGNTGNVTYSTDSTNGEWVGKQTRASTGVSSNAAINVMSQYKILTGNGTQTAVFGNDISVGRNYAIQAYVISFAPPALFAGWGIPL